MRPVLDYRSPPEPAKQKMPSASSGTSLLVLNAIGVAISLLLLMASGSIGTNPRAPTADALSRGLFMLIECSFLVVQAPLGIASIIYACFLPRSEKRLWIFVTAISATLIALVLLSADIWPGSR